MRPKSSSSKSCFVKLCSSRRSVVLGPIHSLSSRLPSIPKLQTKSCAVQLDEKYARRSKGVQRAQSGNRREASPEIKISNPETLIWSCLTSRPTRLPGSHKSRVELSFSITPLRICIERKKKEKKREKKKSNNVSSRQNLVCTRTRKKKKLSLGERRKTKTPKPHSASSESHLDILSKGLQ